MSKLHEAAPVGEGSRGVDRLDRRTNPSAEHTYQLDNLIGLGPKLLKRALKEPSKIPLNLKLVPERCSFRVPSAVVSPALGPAL